MKTKRANYRQTPATHTPKNVLDDGSPLLPPPPCLGWSAEDRKGLTLLLKSARELLNEELDSYERLLEDAAGLTPTVRKKLIDFCRFTIDLKGRKLSLQERLMRLDQRAQSGV